MIENYLFSVSVFIDILLIPSIYSHTMFNKNIRMAICYISDGFEAVFKGPSCCFMAACQLIECGGAGWSDTSPAGHTAETCCNVRELASSQSLYYMLLAARCHGGRPLEFFVFFQFFFFSQYKTNLSAIRISIIKMRRSWNRLIFILGILILIRRSLILRPPSG